MAGSYGMSTAEPEQGVGEAMTSPFVAAEFGQEAPTMEAETLFTGAALESPFAEAMAGGDELVVPGAGYGPAVLTLGSPAVGGLGLASNVIQVPADKSSIRTLLALGGSLQLAQGGARGEAEAFDTEWPEAFEEVQSELAPFA